MLNLDSEDEGQIFIGCAGGRDSVAQFPYNTDTTPKGLSALKIFVGGLKGGHSGDDINKGLGNAVKVLNRLLWQLSSSFTIQLADIKAGNLRNAIAREGWAVIILQDKDKDAVIEFIEVFQTMMQNELHVTDPDISVTC